ncbi:AAA family ATPase [Paraglaciecola chathamensis]|uniref:AAA family ATPase n=1 Tax=Paraglaciecola chathamensis TaxID=368405 RepID=A0ABS0WAQ0_9ALTE|nr:AAA family ATPase [Paraglaciecola chathamensis]MBJ2135535.1 AAA family ATPase [Paraglaciecola chathamensis]|tara:strand:+ start:7647 stop:9854 length:2208 start_codon:yes stop_codon:yes gene_type:complete
MNDVPDSSFEFRCTRVYRADKDYIAFSGVPTNNARKISEREIYVVNTNPDTVPIMPVVGQHWKVKGTFEKVDVSHGDYSVTEVRIKPSECECVLPTSFEAIRDFLVKESCFKGIGPDKAMALIEAFPKNLFNVIKSKDVQLLKDLAGLTQKSAESLIEGFEKYRNLEHAAWLSKINVPLHIIQRIVKYHNKKTIEEITSDPFRLLQFGLPFDEVTNIAKEHFKIEFDDTRRLAAAIDAALQKICAKGHTCASRPNVLKVLTKILGRKKLAIKALDVGVIQASVIVTSGDTFHPLGLLVMENVVAKRMLSLNKITEWSHKHDVVFNEVTSNLPFPLLERQLESIIGAIEHGIYGITGGAGTGKTTVLKAVMQAYRGLGYYVQGVALAGRAAMRLHESTGFECSTVAKFLRGKRLQDGLLGVLIIDEASMIDVATMYKLVMHIPSTMRIMLIGDADQLPPIGAGFVFRDVLKSGVIPSTELNVVKRTGEGSSIPTYSNQIKKGIIPEQLSTNEITYHECDVRNIDKVATDLMGKHKKQNPQIIAMSHQGFNQSYGGVRQLNEYCQKSLNPLGKKLVFSLGDFNQYLNIYENDPVIFTQNNYDANVWNGTMGRLTSVTSNESDCYGLIRTDDNCDVPLTEALLDSIQASYAITLHKAQGSQFERVIIVLTNKKMLSNSWLYTAITRATKHVDIVCSREFLFEAISTEGEAKTRKTYLANLLAQSPENTKNINGVRSNE